MTIIKSIAVTSGEPAGIGPELLLRYIQKPHKPMVAFADPDVLLDIASMLNLNLTLVDKGEVIVDEDGLQAAGVLGIVPVPLAEKNIPGQLNVKNAAAVVESLAQACDGCLSGEYSGLMTAPLHKGIINESGLPFTGHTEFLAQRSGCSQVVMMLASPKLRVALLTTHLPLREVADKITYTRLKEVLSIIDRDVSRLLGSKARIHVLGLNPHAGEDGYLGMEEIDVIQPVINDLRASGSQVYGPYPADTAFNKKALSEADVFLAMFHDQGLPVLKYSGFGESINMTLGLPFLRVSVDHGTALDLAGTGQADIGSFNAAMACFT